MSILKRNLQISLNTLHDWSRENGMVLKVMLITSRQKRNNLHEVSFSLQYNDIDWPLVIRYYVSIGTRIYLGNDHFHHVSKEVSSYL